MSKNRILIIDDDPKLNDLLKGYLEKFGFEAISATHPLDGLNILKKENPDLVILDIMMPDMDGFEVCKEIRKENQIPIIMLTARGELTDKVVGLELGADDYLPKPFEPRELVARIQTVLRRMTHSVSFSKIKLGNLELIPDKYEAYLGSNLLDLSTLEFDLLSLFIKNKEKVLSREQLMDNLHGVDWSVFDRSIDVLVSRLRQKLNDDPKHPEFIKTVRGLGYRFIHE